MEANGWGGTWTWTVFDYHHYHPDAHEALAVASGEAELALGGPGGEILAVRAGDCLVLPAGTGHKLNSSSDDFRICGAYPPGQEDFETRRAEDGIGDRRARISMVALPETDPTTGRIGPLLEHWRQAGTVGDYRYSRSLVEAGEAGLEWNEAAFVAYVQEPTGFLREYLDDRNARGKMSFKLRSEEDAADVWAYIASLSGGAEAD